MKKREARKFLKAVGMRLHQLRKDQEKELEPVAKAVSISRALLSRIERGDYDMRPDLLSRLCAHYNITLGDFFTDVENNMKTE